MVGQHRAIALTELAQEPRLSLNVGEEERDGASSACVSPLPFEAAPSVTVLNSSSSRSSTSSATTTCCDSKRSAPGRQTSEPLAATGLVALHSPRMPS